MNPLDLLSDVLTETGVSLKESGVRARVIVAQEGARLATVYASGEPGFEKVLRASRDLVALKLGLDASLEARATDARVVGVIQSILFGLATR